MSILEYHCKYSCNHSKKNQIISQKHQHEYHLQQYKRVGNFKNRCYLYDISLRSKMLIIQKCKKIIAKINKSLKTTVIVLVQQIKDLTNE